MRGFNRASSRTVELEGPPRAIHGIGGETDFFRLTHWRVSDWPQSHGQVRSPCIGYSDSGATGADRAPRKYFNLNENKNITHRNVWDATETIRGKCTALDACIRQEDKLRINDLASHLKRLGKRTAK